MRKTVVAALLAACLITPALALAATQTQYDKKAAEFAQSGTQTVSLYVDVDLGGRKNGSASELNQAHLAFNKNGYQVQSVVGYTENGDLQGFFVTYVRR